MTALLEVYAARLPEKIREVRDLWDQVEGGSDGASERLQRSIHRVAGSAGTYGYAQLSDVARELEHALEDLPPVGTELTSENRKQIRLLIDTLEKAAVAPPRTPI